MTTLEKLRSAKTRSDLAKILGFVPRGLTYTLFRIPDTEKYREFEIPKKSGGSRTIAAPCAHLSMLQTRLATKLYDCVRELEDAQPNRKRVTHGFQKGRSIITNADRHRNRRYVLNIDIQNFFGAINFGRVRGFFIKDRAFQLQPEIATTIAQIACWQNSLPQGAPSSPVISNLLGHILDIQMLRLSRENRVRYSRYADDLTFSTNQKEFPPTLAVQDANSPSVWTVSPELSGAVRRAGFEINADKTRMQVFQNRQVATGLMINRKVNIKPEYYKALRAMFWQMIKTGTYHFNSATGDRIITDKLDVLEGRFAFAYSVKARTDLSLTEKSARSFEAPKKFVDLYRKLLFYKNFVAAGAPVIVTEGISDILYLRAALKARAARFPKLYAGGMFRVKFLKPSQNLKEVLGLGEGVGGLGKFISTYQNELSMTKKVPGAPVIVLVDNDDASNRSVFGPAKSAMKKAKKAAPEISIVSDDCCHQLVSNLFLIKIPHRGAKQPRVIEELLPSDILQRSVDGKRFDPNKKHGDHTALGKTAFARKIVEPNIANIDFSGFDPIFELMEDALVLWEEYSEGLRTLDEKSRNVRSLAGLS